MVAPPKIIYLESQLYLYIAFVPNYVSVFLVCKNKTSQPWTIQPLEV